MVPAAARRVRSGYRRIIAFLALLAAMAVATGAPAQTVQVPQSREQIQLSFAPLVRDAAPAVVNIYTLKVVEQRKSSPLFDDPFFRRFFGGEFGFGPQEWERKKVDNSLGSGVIVDSKGLVVTNHHVIEGADEIAVVLADRREFAAKVVGTDEHTDLAVLQVETDADLPYLEFHNSDDLEVGDLVLAIGNPFGFGQTVTSGIVSALAQTRLGISDLRFFIQTDAAINPGNSGGALIGMDGRLVGINTAIYSTSGGSHGIGFAVPSNMVRSVLAGLSQGGQLVRPWLGARGQPVTPDIAASLGLERPAGVLVQEVFPGSPAADAGMRTGDVIVGVDGRTVDEPQALRFHLATLSVGGDVGVAVLRDGQEREIRVALTPPPESPPRNVTELSGRHPLSGAVVANLSPALAVELGTDPFQRGVMILDLRPRGTARRLGFEPGDVVRSVRGQEVPTVSRLADLLSRQGDTWPITILRDGRELSEEFTR